MELKNHQAAFLSNYEVLSLINEKKPTTKTVHQESSQLATVMYETSRYLQESPCRRQTPEKIEQLMTLLDDFPIALTKLEKLMICNDPPKAKLKLLLIVQDCEEKLPESEVKEWAKKIKRLVKTDSDSDSDSDN